MTDTTQNLAAASLTFSVLSFLVLSIALVVYFFPSFSATISSGLGSLRGSSSGGFVDSLKMMGAFLGAFSPDITLLAGFVSDIMNGSFRYSVTSLIGVFSVIVHWMIMGLYGMITGTRVMPSSNPVSTVTSAATSAAEAVTSAVAEIGALGVGAANGSTTVSTNPEPDPADIGRLRIPAGPRPPTRSVATNPSAFDTRRDDTRRDDTRRSRKAAERSADKTQRLVASGAVGGALTGYLADKFNPCSIRGLGMFDISQSPMGMVALSSVFMVYILDMTVNAKRSTTDTIIYLLFAGGVYGLNVFAYKEFKCYGNTYSEILRSTLIPIAIGSTLGGIGFGILNSTFPSYLPLDSHTIGSPAAPGGSTCSPPNDKDQFVCDAYKDGKRVSSTTVG
jgi:hypothetical protein